MFYYIFVKINTRFKSQLLLQCIVNSYFKETWNIEFFDNETSGEPGLESYFRMAIEEVVSNPPTK